MKQRLALLLALATLSLCGCGLLAVMPPEPQTAAMSDTAPARTEAPSPRFSVHFAPDEAFSDAPSRLAAERIDPIIRQAVGLLNTMPAPDAEAEHRDYRDCPTERDKLDGDAQVWYDFLYEKLRMLEPFRLLPAEHGGETALYFPFYAAESALMADHREIFLCGTAWMGDDGSIYPIYFMPGGWVDSPTEDREAIRSAAAVYDRTLDRILEKMPPGMSRSETVCYFSFVIALSAEYSSAHQDSVFSPYDTLVQGKTVCHGYARTLSALCRRAEISARYCEGVSPEAGFHAWNCIDTDDGPRYVDVTWYDSPALSDDYRQGNPQYLFMTRQEYDALGYTEGALPADDAP